MVERQLCKLEVRGSNPLASSLRLERRRKARLPRRSKAQAGSVIELSSSTVQDYGLASYDSASPFMTKFVYVYILQSEADPERFYTGLTHDLRTRVKYLPNGSRGD